MWPLTGLLRGPGFLRAGGQGLVGPALSAREDSECMVGVQAPSLALGGGENVSQPDLGSWVQPESGTVWG